MSKVQDEDYEEKLKEFFYPFLVNVELGNVSAIDNTNSLAKAFVNYSSYGFFDSHRQELIECLQEMVAIVKKNSYPQPDKPNSNYARAEWAESIISKALGEE